MLTPRPPRHLMPRAGRQRGIVLLMAIIVLVVLTLGALALTRSVYTSNVIAGNLAFQRAATHSAESGMQAAIEWLEQNRDAPPEATCAGKLLYCDRKDDGYLAQLQGAQPTNWLDYWRDQLQPHQRVVGKEPDTGNTVSYVIERMCVELGDPAADNSGCTVSPSPESGSCSAGSSCSGGEANVKAPSPVYYRITVSVEGPRNTRSLVQAMVAL